MTKKHIEEIIKMRLAVYNDGVSVGRWSDINQFGTTDIMNYIFPKSGQIAYYNLILEQMRKEHSMLTGGMYSLFKMPVQVEREIIDYLKSPNTDLSLLVSDSNTYLKDMDTIFTDHAFTIVNIGKFNTNDIDSLLRLCASHYRYAFRNGVKSYPYFD